MSRIKVLLSNHHMADSTIGVLKFQAHSYNVVAAKADVVPRVP